MKIDGVCMRASNVLNSSRIVIHMNSQICHRIHDLLCPTIKFCHLNPVIDIGRRIDYSCDLNRCIANFEVCFTMRLSSMFIVLLPFSKWNVVSMLRAM